MKVDEYDVYDKILEDNPDLVYTDEDEKSLGGYKTYLDRMQVQAFAKYLKSDIGLPGHFSDGKDSCQVCFKVKGCLDKENHANGGIYTSLTKMSCYSKGCVKCCPDATRREARRACERMIAMNLRINAEKIMLHHDIVSPPEIDKISGRNGSVINNFDLNQTISGRKILNKRARMMLDVVYDPNTDRILFHIEDKADSGYYGVHSDKIAYVEQSEIDKVNNDNKNKTRGGVQFDHGYRFESGLISADYSPHFHNITYGWIASKYVTDKIEDITGWVIKRRPVNIESKFDCYNVCLYILSHGAVYLKSDAKRSAEHGLRYFGEAQNKVFKTESVLKYSVSSLEQMDFVANSFTDQIHHKKEYYELRKITSRHFKLKSVNELRKRKIDGKIKFVSSLIDKVSFTESVFDMTLPDSRINFKDGLRSFIKPRISLGLKDNPAFSRDVQTEEESDLVKATKAYASLWHKEELKELESLGHAVGLNLESIPVYEDDPEDEGVIFEGLQITAEYSFNSKVQSVQTFIILDHDKTCICPECSAKLRLLVPVPSERGDFNRDRIADFIKSHSIDQIESSADLNDWGYYSHWKGAYYLGMPYYTEKGEVKNESGIYNLPSCLNDLTLDMYSRITRNFKIQEARFEYRKSVLNTTNKSIKNDLKQMLKDTIDYIESGEVVIDLPTHKQLRLN